MANQNQIKFGVGYQVDKASVQKVKQSLRQLQQVKLGDFSGSVKEFVRMQEMADQVRIALNKAFNVNLNSLNTEKFNQQLGLSANKINEIYTLFSKAGATGQRAFSSLTSSILTTNLKLRQTQSLISTMGQTMANTIKWGIASSVMNTFTNSVRQAFEYVKNLDSALTDIRIVTGDSTQKMKEFSVQANQAAQSLGRSTMDYTKAALTFYQQGLSDEDVQARTQSVLVAQNITGAGQEMADYLTAVWNGYKVANEEAELYVDKLAAVADSSASNMSQLAIAMSKVASTANMLGVPVDSLNAQIATIVATTRQAPESVGNALKTIYARINDIATGADDAQISLGNYSEKMAEVGISVLDANGRLRDTGDVIDEVGQKWATLSREQQIYLARTMAGQRQYNNLLALFENWGRYTELVNVSMDAQGAAMEKNERYMDSLAAKMEQFGAAGERVKSALVNQNDLKGLTDFGTKAVNLFANIIESIGGGGNAMLAFGSIVTSVFSNTIAKEINGFITNLQNVKYNAEQTTKQFELMKVVAQSEGANEAGTKALMGQLQAAQAYYKFMTPAQQNEYNATAAQIAQLQTEADVNKKLLNDAKQVQEAFDIQIRYTDYEKFGQSLEESIVKPLKNLKAKSKIEITELKTILNQFVSHGFDVSKITGGQQALDLFEKLKNSANASDEELRQLADRIIQVGQNIFTGFNNWDNIDQLARKFHLSKDQAELLAQQLKRTREELKQFSTVKTFVNMASAIGGIASAINSVVNITKIWKNENLSTGEKLLQIFTNLGMVVGMFATNIGKLREGFDLLITKLLMSSTAMGTLAMSEEAASIQTATLAGTFKGLWQVLKANPIILILSAVTTGIALYNKFHMSAEEAAQAIDKFNQKQKESLNNIENYSKGSASLEQVKEEYEELAAKAGAISFDSNIDDLTQAERARYNEIKQLVKQYNEDAVIGYNKQGQAILANNNALQNTIKLLQDQKQAQIDLVYGGAQYQQAEKARQVQYSNASTYAQSLQKQLSNLQNPSVDNNPFDSIVYTYIEEKIGNGIINQANLFDKKGNSYLEALKNYLSQIINGTKEYSQQTLLSLISPMDQQLSVISDEYASQFKESLQNAINNYLEQINKIQGQLSLAQEDKAEKAKFDTQSVIGVLQTTENNKEYNQVAAIYGESFTKGLLKNYVEGLERGLEDGLENETEVAQNAKKEILSPLIELFSEGDFIKLQQNVANKLKNIDLSSLNAQAYSEQIGTFIYQVLEANQKLQQLAKENPQRLQTFLSTLFGLDTIDISSYFPGIGLSIQFEDANKKTLEDTKTDVIKVATTWVDEQFGKYPEYIQAAMQKQLTSIIENAPLDTLQLFLNGLLDNVKIDFSNVFSSGGYLQTGDIANEVDRAINQATEYQEIYDQATSGLDTLNLLGNKDNLKDDQLIELQEGLNKLIQTYPELTDAVQILNNEQLEGTRLYQKALEQVTDQILTTAEESLRLGADPQELAAKILPFVTNIEILQNVYNRGLLTNVNYSDSLIKIASNYESCADELNKYLFALQQQDQELIAASQMQLTLAARAEESGQKYGISAERISQLSKHYAENAEAYDLLNSQGEANLQVANDMAVAYIRLNDAFADLTEGSEEYIELLTQLNEYGLQSVLANEEMASSYENLRQIIAGLIGTDQDFISNDFIAKQAENLKIIAEGGENAQAALEQLQQAATEDIVANLRIDTSAISEYLPEAYQDIADWANNLPEGQLSVDDLKFTNQLIWAMQQAGYAQSEIEAALDGMQLDVDLQPYVAGLNKAVDAAAEASDALVDVMGIDTQSTTETQTNTDTNEVTGYTVREQPFETEVVMPKYGTARAGRDTVAVIKGTQTARVRYPGIIATPTNESSEAQKQVTTTALMATNGRKRSGGNIKHSNRKTSTPKSGSGGGSKGGGSTKQPSVAKISTDTISTKQKQTPYNPYQEVEKSYERQEDLLKDLDELEKHLQGEDRLNNIQKQNKELIKQNSIIEERQKISEDAAEQGSTAWYRNQLLADEALRDVVQFDPDGQVNEIVSKQAITDAFNRQLAEQKAYYEAAQNSYNNWIENVWNKYSGEQQQANKKQKEQYDEDLKNAKKNAQDKIKIAEEEYNDRTKLLESYQKALEEDNKFYEQYLDNIEKLIENRIAESKIKVDLAFDFGQTERQWEEFENKFIKRLQKDDIFANAKASFRELQSYFNSSEITQAQKEIDKVRKEIALIQSGQYSSIYGITQQEFNNLTESDRNNLQKRFLDQATKDLQDYQKKLMDSLEEVQDKQEEIQELYLDSIDKAKDKMDDVISQYERINDLVEHNIKLTELLYGDNAGFDIRNSYYNRQSVNNSRMLEALRQQQAYWQSQLNNATPDTEDWRRFKENLENVTDAINSALENQLDLLATKFENKIQGALANIQNKLTNGLGNTFLDNQWEFINDDDEAFLDAVNSKFGIDEVEQLYEDAAAGAEGNIVQQQRINKLMNDQLKALREKDKLTQYDIDRAKAALEVEKARMALEDARNNKTKMRLRRDSQGNYTYQYVADEEKLSDLQSALADAESQLYNMDKEHYKQQLNEMYDTYKDYLERRADLEREMQATQDANERARIQARIKLLEETYTEYADNITGDLQYTLSNYLTESAAAGLGVDLSQYSTAEQIEFLKDNLPYVNTEIQNLADTITGEDGILNSTRQYLDELTAAFTEYNQEVQDTLSLAGTSVLSIASTLDDQAIAQTEKWLGLYQNATLETQNVIQNMQQLLEEMQKFMNEDFSSSDVIQSLYKAEQMIQKILNPDQIDENTILTGTSATIGYGTLGPDQDINILTDEQRQALESLQNDYLTQQANFNTLADELALSDINSYTETILANADEILDSIYDTYKDDLKNRLIQLLLQDVGSLDNITSSLGNLNNSQTLDQNVTIEALFPNVTNHTEIEQALNNLVNMASQQAARPKP